VATYGSEPLKELEGGAEFLRAAEEDDEGVILTEADHNYLKTLEEWLGKYPEVRTTDYRGAQPSGKARSMASMRSASERCK
jgi:hypothetical protein